MVPNSGSPKEKHSPAGHNVDAPHISPPSCHPPLGAGTRLTLDSGEAPPQEATSGKGTVTLALLTSLTGQFLLPALTPAPAPLLPFPGLAGPIHRLLLSWGTGKRLFLFLSPTPFPSFVFKYIFTSSLRGFRLGICLKHIYNGSEAPNLFLIITDKSSPPEVGGSGERGVKVMDSLKGLGYQQPSGFCPQRKHFSPGG